METGDQEFEKFFKENHGDGEEGINPSCHQRLMLDAISNRADTVNNMYNATAEFLSAVSQSDSSTMTPIDSSTLKNAQNFLTYLMDQAKITVSQSDYLISRIMDGFPTSEEDGEDDEFKKEI
jgi:hypothetical protein